MIETIAECGKDWLTMKGLKGKKKKARKQLSRKQLPPRGSRERGQGTRKLRAGPCKSEAPASDRSMPPALCRRVECPEVPGSEPGGQSAGTVENA